MPLDKVDITTHHSVHPLLPTTHTLYSRSAVLYEEGASKAVYYDPDPESKSLNAPIYLSNNFQYDAEIYQQIVDGDRVEANIYGRCGNPSEYKFEDQVALLESADGCLAVASGMAAVSTTWFALLKTGDHIVSDWTTYSSTHEMFDHRLTDFGIESQASSDGSDEDHLFRDDCQPDDAGAGDTATGRTCP